MFFSFFLRTCDNSLLLKYFFLFYKIMFFNWNKFFFYYKKYFGCFFYKLESSKNIFNYFLRSVSLLRSPFVFKTSFEQFEVRVNKGAYFFSSIVFFNGYFLRVFLNFFSFISLRFPNIFLCIYKFIFRCRFLLF